MLKTFEMKFVDVSVAELNKIGFDKSYVNYAVNKHKFVSVKICDLTCAQANIIKQTALSVGTDCAVNREVVTGSIEKSDCILSGSYSQLQKIVQKLSYQPFFLKKLGEQLSDMLNNKPCSILIRGYNIDFTRPLVMGILNVTPDSFSDGGCFNNTEAAVSRFKQMIEEGADIIDIGGESTRPDAVPVSFEHEYERVVPVIQQIRKFDDKTLISIDTRNAQIAQKAAECGADIINDVSGLEYDSNMIDVVKNSQLPIVLTHSHDVTSSDDAVSDIFKYFSSRLSHLIEAGVSKSNIILDPGLGFGKTYNQNFEIINGIKEFKSFNLPILVGHSRKSFIQNKINTTDIDLLDNATLLLSQKLVENGVNIVRVHDVRKHNILKNLYS